MKTILLSLMLFATPFIIAQVTYIASPEISYDATLCEEELLKEQIICLNILNEYENSLDLNLSLTPHQICAYTDNIPTYINYVHTPMAGYPCQGVCCGNGDFSGPFTFGIYDSPINTTAYYNFELNCINNSNIAITKLDKTCWQVRYLNLGTFLFSIDINVRPGRDIEGVYNACDDTTFYYSCGQDRSFRQFVVDVGSQYECNDYEEEDCNLIQNGGFEDMINCPTDFESIYAFYVDNYNLGLLENWEKCNNNSNPHFYSTCSDYFGTFPKFPFQPLPSGNNYLSLNLQKIGQFVTLCEDQKYQFGFYGSIHVGGSPYPNAHNQFLVLEGINTSDFLTPQPSITLSTIQMQTLTHQWLYYSSEFVSPADFNGIQIGGAIFIDNVSLVPVDTVEFTTNFITNACDSASLIVNIPGCYGPYNLLLNINGQEVSYTQIEDGDIITVPLPTNAVFTVKSITNATGCTTDLNVTDSIIAPGNAAFSSTDFCLGDANVITFFGNQGVFSLVSDTTNATINSSTGILSNVTGNTNYIIQHTYCVDTHYDTVFVYHNDASFTSTDICVGAVNTIDITGTTSGTFSLLPPSNGATINQTTGVIQNSSLGNQYTIQYVVGTVCADSTIQTIEVLQLEDASFTTADFCVNSTNDVVITGTTGGFFSFFPDPGDGAIIDITSGQIEHQVVNNTYTIQYVTTGYCKDSTTQTITVLGLPTAVISGAGGDLCTNDSLPVTVTLTGVAPWEIVISNGNSTQTFSNILTSPFTTYMNVIGNYTVASVTDSQCSNIGDSLSSVVMTGEDIEVFTDAINGCIPSEISFWTNVTGQNFDCIWNFGNGNIIGSCDTVTTIYSESGFYTVQFSVSSPQCQTDTILMNLVEIYEHPVSSFSFIPEKPSIANNTLQTTNLSEDNLLNYWLVNSSIVSTEIEPLIDLPSIIQDNDFCLVVENIHECRDTSCMLVFVSDESLIYLPNAFIPDNDGLNDVFGPVASNLRYFELQVFNRWGEMIFETTDLNKGWDGTYKGIEVQPGVYTYTLIYRFQGEQENKTVYGHVTLIR